MQIWSVCKILFIEIISNSRYYINRVIKHSSSNSPQVMLIRFPKERIKSPMTSQCSHMRAHIALQWNCTMFLSECSQRSPVGVHNVLPLKIIKLSNESPQCSLIKGRNVPQWKFTTIPSESLQCFPLKLKTFNNESSQCSLIKVSNVPQWKCTKFSIDIYNVPHWNGHSVPKMKVQ